MQNEELRQAQLDLEAARDKYSDLYDFAPVGYFSISDKGLILDANLMGTTMLGIEREKLTGRHFSQFIAKDDQDIFYLYRQKLFETKTKQVCELKLTKKDKAEFYAQLESYAVKDEPERYHGAQESRSGTHCNQARDRVHSQNSAGHHLSIRPAGSPNFCE
jgi:PAS domain S-box-containing protein